MAKLRQTVVTEKGIYGFFGEYRWLSNFHVEPVTVDGVTYASSEHAYMAMKTFDPAERKKLVEIISPADARKYGQTVTLRPDWERVKYSMMKKVVLAKFSQSRALKKKLLATGDKYLEETNDWNDRYWGRGLDGFGENNLGKILMEVREELRKA